MCDIGVFGSLKQLVVLVQKCCVGGRRTFSGFFRVLGAAVRLRAEDAAQTPWEMLMDKTQLASFPRKANSGSFRSPPIPPESLLRWSVCDSPLCGLHPGPRAPFSCWGSEESEVGKRRNGAGQSVPVLDGNVSATALLTCERGSRAGSKVQKHQQWPWIQMYLWLILAKIVSESWCGSSQYFLVLSSCKDDE